MGLRGEDERTRWSAVGVGEVRCAMKRSALRLYSSEVAYCTLLHYAFYRRLRCVPDLLNSYCETAFFPPAFPFVGKGTANFPHETKHSVGADLFYKNLYIILLSSPSG